MIKRDQIKPARAIVNIEDKTIIKKTIMSRTTYRWQSIQSITMCATWNFWDEIALVCHFEDDDIFVGETDKGYTELMNALTIPEQLPEDWYPRVENGETFSVVCNRS